VTLWIRNASPLGIPYSFALVKVGESVYRTLALPYKRNDHDQAAISPTIVARYSGGNCHFHYSVWCSALPCR
jgi:hypothetical protein